MEVRVKQESQDEALVPLCSSNKSAASTDGASAASVPSGVGECDGGANLPGPMQKVPSLSDLSDPESSLGKFPFSCNRWLLRTLLISGRTDGGGREPFAFVSLFVNAIKVHVEHTSHY